MLPAKRVPVGIWLPALFGNRFLAAASTVLIIVPDREFRRSLEFALEVEGFAVASYASLSEAMATPDAWSAFCAVVDDGALRIDPFAQHTLDRLLKPVILLVDGFSPAGLDRGPTVLTKPLQGRDLIEMVRAQSAPSPTAA
ncbi:FixT2 anti-kinase protein [Mesorhizobium alhagi CCNWXJ12-2]|jgi:DNA-binding response OmpR family regulator|uniref:FixT2 anti-kinase protein n=1 Tax=Mesorhizobium alhagi CCNWXJ12-2 TaxID=1107882 RepID=H0I1F3_9HYPH|nr:FixT2 anti-kinase protein [Mesorhizobium alhagi CCNWXJ12-2]